MTKDKFKKRFSESLLREAVPAAIPAADDATAFEGSFENPEAAQGIEGEIQNVAMDETQKQTILKKADKYAELINSSILPALRRLHDDIISGVFAQIAPDIKGVSGITEDLARLAESLRGRSRDAVLKAGKNTEK